MATLQKISHGEPNWDVKVNAIIDELEKTEGSIGDVAKNMKWVAGKDGIVVTNDYFRAGTDCGYSYLEIGGNKIVNLYVHLIATKDFTGSATGYVLQLPESIKPGSPMKGVASEIYQWMYDGKIGFLAYNKDSTVKMNANDDFIIHAMYVL